MIVTSHGKKRDFFKGVSAFTNERGRPLVFFGYSRGHVLSKEANHLDKHLPDSVSEPRPATKPLLRLVSSN